MTQEKSKPPPLQKSSLWPKTKSIYRYIWDYLDIWY